MHLVPSISFDKVDYGPCDVRLRAKQTRIPFPINEANVAESFYLLHCDIWGPYQTLSLSGAHYFLTIVDDKSRGVWIYLMIEKSEAYGILFGFHSMVKTQFGRQIKIIPSDNRREFTSGLIRQFYSNNGILHQTTCIDTLQQNGHIINVARALRFLAGLPLKF